MKPGLNRLIAIAGLVLISGAGAAGQTATASQQLVLEVKPVTRLIVTGAPLPMMITADGGPGSVTDANSQYSIVTNLGSMRIAASIDRPMPSGTSLAILLESSKGTSRGEVDITHSTESTEVVAGIRPGFDRGQRISYRFSALPGVTEVASQERTVTLTLTD